jgi:cyclophilin family peptidyl-prolyl cis-trans isomerase
VKINILLSLVFIFSIIECKTETASNSTIQAIINTSKGEIILELEFEKTPITVANFVGLAEGSIKNSTKEEGEPYYDGFKFHRVIKDFMIQGGYPSGTGHGDMGKYPGYDFEDELNNPMSYDKGIIKLVLKIVTRILTHISMTSTAWISTLYHKIFNYSMKFKTIIVRFSFFFGTIFNRTFC